MANTTSIAFPDMFNVSQNRVSVLQDSKSVVNRTRLLMLSNPKEMYNDPDFGLGLYRHMWQYNTDNQKGVILNKLKEQLRRYEPFVIPDDTEYADGLLFTGSSPEYKSAKTNELEMTIMLRTTFSDRVPIRVGEEDVLVE